MALCNTASSTTGLPPGHGKTKFFQSQGKVREFCKKSGKISVLVKVREFFEIKGEKSGDFLEFRECTGFSGNSRDFERKAFQMPSVQNPVKNVKILNMKIRISMVYRRN